MKQKIESIFEFCPSNKLVYDKLMQTVKSNSGIMPFVGYDLVSFNYGSRDEFLEYLITSNNLNNDRDELISVDYLESLDRILNKLTSGVMNYRDLLEWSIFEDYYSEEKIDLFRAIHEPINLIKWINGGSAITINFDKIYEALNENRLDIATPFNKALLNHFNRKDTSVDSVVFKVYGDLFSDRREVLLSKDEFQKAYGDEEFLSMLQKWLDQYIILFIGIDVFKDDYLKSILINTKQEGVIHYAIIGCEDDDQKRKEILTKYTDIKVNPILFDKNKPDSLRVILHKLLVDSQNEEWIRSFKRGPLHYLYDDQVIVGRNEQIKELCSFLSDDCDFLFCSISSNNISGKSKLAYEFAQTYAVNWRWYMVPFSNIYDFLTKQSVIFEKIKKKQNTLIVFDDYSLYNEPLTVIYEFIMKIKRYCLKIRVIFISTDLKESNFLKPMSEAAKKFFYDSDYLYKNFKLNILDREDIMEMCFQYVLFRKVDIGLIDDVIKEWKLEIHDKLRDYIDEVIVDYPQEAVLFSMIYAVKLTLNFLNISTSDSDRQYVYSQAYNYALSEGIDVDFHTAGVDRKQLQHNRAVRTDHIEQYFEELNKNKEYISTDTKIVYTDSQEFSNKFEQDDININDQLDLGD